MKNVLTGFKRSEKGFTLIELLAVIVILAVIAAIAIPLINGVIDRSRNSANIATARQAYDAARLFLSQENNGDYTTELVPIIGAGTTYTAGATTAAGAGAGLVSKGYLDASITMPSSKVAISGGYVQFGTSGNLTTVIIETGAAGTGKRWTFDAATVNSGNGTVTAVDF